MAVQRSVVAKLTVFVAALDPGDAEACVRGANDTRDLDGNLRVADLREGIVHPGMVIQRDSAAIRGEIVGA